ncbi:MAG: HNH endonuclease [Alphaproteobacteria bacterium]|nr:HNH endonuclease [Alphaproteobacteria bacterium]
MKVNWTKEKEQVETLITEGVPYERIGEMYGVSGNAVKKAARKLGIELPKKRAINPNEHFNKGLRHSNAKSGYNQCPICGKEKTVISELCMDCRNKQKRENIKYRTLGSYIDGHKYLSTKCSEIRRDARRTIETSDKEKVCAYCHNHDFDQILEVHHLKGILEFDSSATIGEVNDIDNLVWLCPNHHQMLELGLITL